jgi:hypothetical protein
LNIDLTNNLRSISVEVEKHFSALTIQQLNWRPAPGSWSIGQCLHHLINTNKTYIPIFENIISGKYKKTFWEKISPFSKSIGKSMIDSLGKDMKQIFKAPKIFQPSNKNIPQSITEDFLAHQQNLLELFEKMKSPDFDEYVITSPVSGLITFRLRDFQQAMCNHEERHLAQALRIKNHENFPSGFNV